MIAAKLAVDLRIATRASQDEFAFQRMTRSTNRAAYDASYQVLDEVLTLSATPDKPYIGERMRMICNRRT